MWTSIIPAGIAPVLFTASLLAAPQQELELRRAGGLTEVVAPGGTVLRETTAEVVDPRLVRGPEGRARVALWSEREGGALVELHAIDPDGGGFRRVRAIDYELHLKRARFDPVVGQPPVALEAARDCELFLVQYVCQPLESFDRALEALGAAVHHYMPQHARLVRMDPQLVDPIAALGFVRWVGPYHPEYRLEPWLLEHLGSPAVAGPARYHVQVLEKGPAQKTLVAARIRALGGRIDALIPDGYLLQATLTREQLLAVAGFDEVLWIDRWSAPEVDLDNVRAVGGADFLETLTGYTGQGVRGEVMDGNVRWTHAALQSPPILLHGNNAGGSDHGTKTTGCVFGDGTGSANGRGVLPDAQPIFADYGQVSNRYAHTQELLQPPYFAVFQSNSWGNATTTEYTSISMEMDDILFDFDITIFQSQSNTGTQESRPQAWAKNIVSIGGIDHQDTANLSDDDWEGIASIGPAADDRIKPDLAFWAEQIRTTDNETDTDYTSGFGGTSAATPCAAGFAGLVQQMWSEGLFGNTPSGGTVFERRAKATTVRALMINSATQYAFSGAADDLTRTHQGWGLPSVQTLYERRERTFVVDEGDPLLNLESTAYPLLVPDGEPALMATLVYLDLPGTTSSDLHRINDLSLRVSSPSGEVYWGNNGLRTKNWSTPGGSSNTRDVVENVFVQSPEPGLWTVEVLADEVISDSHVETPAKDADYALVVSGVETAPCPVPSAYCDAKPTSLGSTPAIGWSGTPSVAANAFGVTLSGAVPGQPAIVFWGDAAASQPAMGGTLCVQPPFLRSAPIALDGAGAGEWTLDISGRSPGATQFYQAWFRDPADPTGFGVGLSDGLEVTYCD